MRDRLDYVEAEWVPYEPSLSQLVAERWPDRVQLAAAVLLVEMVTATAQRALRDRSKGRKDWAAPSPLLWLLLKGAAEIMARETEAESKETRSA